MPFPRRGRRRPFVNARWQIRRLDALCLYLSSSVRSTLTAWMKIYGETNDVAGLITGPIEVRFRRLREHTGADLFLLWTTPERWAAGEALSLSIPAIGLALECRFDDGKLVVDKAKPTGQEERDPRRQRTAIGMELRPESIELPTSDMDTQDASAGLVAAFEKLLDRRWTSFVDPLREALEAEARDDATRAEKLATPFAVSTPRIGSQSESDPYRLSGVEASAVAAFDEGEWLDLVDTRGRVISSARLVRIDPAEGVMDIDVRGADPPSEGIVRPRPQVQILAQKRAILEELDNPTGGLANAVKLVASPASLPPPQKRRPAAFVNKLVAQNRSQVRAVSLALGLDEGQALMIQGPPGTGKSTTLAEILGQLVTRDKNVTVLVCSHSNHGVDNLLLKTLPYLESVPELAIARVGLFDRVNPLARPHFVPPGEDLGAFNVVFTTVDALALQVEAGGRTYDYAVLDEANRASILDSLIPLVRGRRFILVGDHLQLQPVLSEAEEALRLEPAVGNNSAIGKSLFAWLRERRFPEAATIFLDEQNRMHPVIAGLISEVFYEGKLRSGRKAPRRAADVPLFPSPVTWVDTRGLHGLREARGRGASLVNVPEARLVATIARHILGTSGREADVGVISAYAEQTALLRRLLLNRNNQRQGGPNGQQGQNGQSPNGKGNVLDRAALKHLEIDTVDAFEGREKDIILVSLVRSNRRRDIGFLRLMQRINVALSRARTMLIIVGDTSTLRGSYFDRIIRYIRTNGMLVPGPRLIGRLLNARSGERPAAAVAGERPGLPGRRRRPLPSARTAFPAQDPATAAAGPEGAAADGEDGQRGRRRRRRVRGRGEAEQQQRPPIDRRALPPTTTMELAPAEPGADEPATQYEIDRFAALVEQLLGDTGGDENAGSGAESAAPPEVDRAHAGEVLADALRAVGEQADRTGPSRSRRGNNRRRSRRGQGRPLPGDAAVADAARRMAREELLAAEVADDGAPRTDVAATDAERAAGYAYDTPQEAGHRDAALPFPEAPRWQPAEPETVRFAPEPERPTTERFTPDQPAARFAPAPERPLTERFAPAPERPTTERFSPEHPVTRSFRIPAPRPGDPPARPFRVPVTPATQSDDATTQPAQPPVGRRSRRPFVPLAPDAGAVPSPAADRGPAAQSATPSEPPAVAQQPAAATGATAPQPAMAPALLPDMAPAAPPRRTRRRAVAAASGDTADTTTPPVSVPAPVAELPPVAAEASVPDSAPAPAAASTTMSTDATPAESASNAPVRRTRRTATTAPTAAPALPASAAAPPASADISQAPVPASAETTLIAVPEQAPPPTETPTRPRASRRRATVTTMPAPPADAGAVIAGTTVPEVQAAAQATAAESPPASVVAAGPASEPAVTPKPAAPRGRRRVTAPPDAAPEAALEAATPDAAPDAAPTMAADPPSPGTAPTDAPTASVSGEAAPAPKPRRARVTKATSSVSLPIDALPPVAEPKPKRARRTATPTTSASTSEASSTTDAATVTGSGTAVSPTVSPADLTDAPAPARPKRPRRTAPAPAAADESPADA